VDAVKTLVFVPCVTTILVVDYHVTGFEEAEPATVGGAVVARMFREQAGRWGWFGAVFVIWSTRHVVSHFGTKLVLTF
jgi:hypothetical protein